MSVSAVLGVAWAAQPDALLPFNQLLWQACRMIVKKATRALSIVRAREEMMLLILDAAFPTPVHHVGAAGARPMRRSRRLADL